MGPPERIVFQKALQLPLCLNKTPTASVFRSYTSQEGPVECIILATRKSASEERSEELPSSYNNFPSIIRLIKKNTIFKGSTIQFITIQ